ncbi:unnamed protein product [Amaranthus hypochondriacus]
MAAIKLLHGWRIKKWEIKVSLARYSRDGSPFVSRNLQFEKRFRVISTDKRGFKETCSRGNKSYAEVLNGPRRTVETNALAIHAKNSVKADDSRELEMQPSTDQGSSQVLESNNNNPDSESMAIFPLLNGTEMSFSNKNKDENENSSIQEKLGVVEELPPPAGQEKEPPRQSPPKPSIVAGADSIKEQPKTSEHPKHCLIKKTKGKRGLLNSKEIADYLGFYTSGPSPAVSSKLLT